jgi:hypothetical protein
MSMRASSVIRLKSSTDIRPGRVPVFKMRYISVTETCPLVIYRQLTGHISEQAQQSALQRMADYGLERLHVVACQ